ncbi:MAG TPA: MerR family transcriptional regulator, partial [Actinomycetota bacterium]|nr:MerR family transcriptional regulator [Actinomycetota bacterium]
MAASIYSIGAVARMVGVPTATLRTWEERYELVVPERSPGGHRLYTRDQVEQLRFVLRHIERGLQPADAHRLLADRLTETHDEDP